MPYGEEIQSLERLAAASILTHLQARRLEDGRVTEVSRETCLKSGLCVIRIPSSWSYCQAVSKCHLFSGPSRDGIHHEARLRLPRWLCWRNGTRKVGQQCEQQYCIVSLAGLLSNTSTIAIRSHLKIELKTWRRGTDWMRGHSPATFCTVWVISKLAAWFRIHRLTAAHFALKSVLVLACLCRAALRLTELCSSTSSWRSPVPSGSPPHLHNTLWSRAAAPQQIRRPSWLLCSLYPDGPILPTSCAGQINDPALSDRTPLICFLRE